MFCSDPNRAHSSHGRQRALCGNTSDARHTCPTYVLQIRAQSRCGELVFCRRLDFSGTAGQEHYANPDGECHTDRRGSILKVQGSEAAKIDLEPKVVDATGLKLDFPYSRGWPWRVFLTCWVVYTAFWAPYIVREHFPAIALVERGSLNVDRYLGWSPDIFQGPRGGAYINNNPGASFTGAIPLLLLRPVLTRVDAWNQKLPRPS